MFQCIFRISNRHLSRQVSVSLVDLADRGGVYSEVDERDPDRSSTEDSVRSPEYNSDDSPATWSIKKRAHTPDWLASALFGNQRYEVHWLGYRAILRLAFLEPCFVLAPAGSPPMIRRVGETWPSC